MKRRLAAGSWIADVLPENVSIACGAGRSVAIAMAEIADRRKCARLLTNSPLCASLAQNIPMTLVAAQLDHLDTSFLVPCRSAENGLSYQIGIHAFSTVTRCGEILTTGETSLGAKRFFACARERVFLLTTPLRLIREDGAAVGHLSEFAERGVQVTFVITRNLRLPDVHRGSFDAKFGTFESLNSCFRNMEVWTV